VTLVNLKEKYYYTYNLTYLHLPLSISFKYFLSLTLHCLLFFTAVAQVQRVKSNDVLIDKMQNGNTVWKLADSLKLAMQSAQNPISMAKELSLSTPDIFQQSTGNSIISTAVQDTTRQALFKKEKTRSVDRPAVQSLDSPATKKLSVFVDCNTYCDMNFIRTELTLVDFLLDRTVADVHILISVCKKTPHPLLVKGFNKNWSLNICSQVLIMLHCSFFLSEIRL
jgi:hypothetical protein